MSYSPTELKKGVVIEIDGKPYRVIDYNQKVMGRGGSIVNVKVKNLIDGSVIPKTFKGQEKIESAEVTNQTVQYLYKDGVNYFFMDPDTFEQFELSSDLVDESAGYLKEGENITLQSFLKSSKGTFVTSTIDVSCIIFKISHLYLLPEIPSIITLLIPSKL